MTKITVWNHFWCLRRCLQIQTVLSENHSRSWRLRSRSRWIIVCGKADYLELLACEQINLSNSPSTVSTVRYTPSELVLCSICSHCMEGIYRAGLFCKVVELQSCQEELTHAKLAHRPSGYSNWNVGCVCCDLSQHRKWSAAVTSSGINWCLHWELNSQSYSYLQRWPFQTEEVEAPPPITPLCHDLQWRSCAAWYPWRGLRAVDEQTLPSSV